MTVTKFPFQYLSMTVNIPSNATATADTASFWDAYSAFQAVWSMCGAKGRGGIARDIGT